MGGTAWEGEPRQATAKATGRGQERGKLLPGAEGVVVHPCTQPPIPSGDILTVSIATVVLRS